MYTQTLAISLAALGAAYFGARKWFNSETEKNLSDKCNSFVSGIKEDIAHVDDTESPST